MFTVSVPISICKVFNFYFLSRFGYCCGLLRQNQRSGLYTLAKQTRQRLQCFITVNGLRLAEVFSLAFVFLLRMIELIVAVLPFHVASRPFLNLSSNFQPISTLFISAMSHSAPIVQCKPICRWLWRKIREVTLSCRTKVRGTRRNWPGKPVPLVVTNACWSLHSTPAIFSRLISFA